MIDHKHRAHALLSASSAARWLACPPSAIAAELYPATDTDYTREGTLAHETAEAIMRGDPIPQGADAEMIRHAEGYRDYINSLLETDNAVALVEQRVDFSPWVQDGFGTADCILIQGDTMDVIDYKYGQGVAVAAQGNPQMQLYALGAVNDYGFAYDVSLVRMHVYQPRKDNISVAEIDVKSLLEWADTYVKPRAADAYKGEGNYCAGAHCTFCPHAGQCRELTRLCTAYVEDHNGLRHPVDVLAPHEIAEVLAMEPIVSLWLRKVKAQALTTMLDGGGIPGYKVVAGRGSRGWDDDIAVANALEAAGYGPGEYTETVLLSPAKLEKSIGKKAVAEKLRGHILKTTGAPTIAPETDKRPAYDREAEALKDFE